MTSVYVRGPSGPFVLFRFERDVIAIGRATENDLVLVQRDVSRRHAEIRRQGDGWWVADRGSRHGTAVNGGRLRAPRRLAAGDEIGIAGAVIRFEQAPADALPEGQERETGGEIWATRGQGTAEMPALVGSSEAIAHLRAMIERIAPSDSTVLLTGESGTGKELVSRLLHLRSPRACGRFVVIDCPALASSLHEAELFGVEKGTATGVEGRAGRLEAANGGTLVLDEVADLDPAAQAKLLRFLQDRRVTRVGGRDQVRLDVRVIAATNRDLGHAITDGSFRLDLYYRLKVVTLRLPPLRERREDIAPLAEHFLALAAPPRRALAPEALDLLMGHVFPGNVRELEHLLEGAHLLAGGPSITAPDLLRQMGSPARHSDSAAGDQDRSPEALYDRLVRGGESFWEVVAAPLHRKEVTRATVRALIERAYEKGGGSYKGVARIFGIERDHRRLLDFLRNNRLRVGETGARRLNGERE